MRTPRILRPAAAPRIWRAGVSARTNNRLRWKSSAGSWARSPRPTSGGGRARRQARRLSPRGEASDLPIPAAGLCLANLADAVLCHEHRSVAGVRVCPGAVLMVRKARSTRRKPRAPRKAKRVTQSIARVEVQELESIRAEIERLAQRSAPPRWNADPEDVRRSISARIDSSSCTSPSQWIAWPVSPCVVLAASAGCCALS